MQPFVNPYLFNNQCYPTMPSAQYSPGLNGKYVNDFNEITASDVPMGGQPSVFIKSDRGEIQLREWSPTGQIVTTLYKPHIDVLANEVSNVSQDTQKPLFDASTEIIEPIFERLSQLEEKLDKLSKPTRSKKDGEQDAV